MNREYKERKDILRMIQAGELTIEESIQILEDHGFDNSKKTEVDTVYYRTLWEEDKRNSKQLQSQLSGNLLIFTDQNVNIPSVSENSQVVLVKRGKEYAKTGEGIYQINPSSQEEYAQLLNQLKEINFHPDHIWYLWSCEKFESNEATINNQLSIGIFSVVYLIQQIIRQKNYKKIQLIYAYREEDFYSQPLLESISALGKTIYKENPQIEIKTVAFSGGDTKFLDQFDKIMKEHVLGYTINNSVAYKEGQRWIKTLKEINIETEKKEKIKLRDKGVYLITGGTGKLGMIFAEYLIKKCRANVILVGRSENGLEKEEKVERLKNLGTDVDYIQANLSNIKDVEKLTTQVKMKYGAIHGVLHAAGVIRDSFILKKTENELKEVISPKIYGTVWLDEILKDEK
jgi:polyketide synthase PksN